MDFTSSVTHQYTRSLAAFGLYPYRCLEHEMLILVMVIRAPGVAWSSCILASGKVGVVLDRAG